MLGGIWGYVAIAAVVFGLGFGSAWQVQSWRGDAALAAREAQLVKQATVALKTQRDQDAVTAAASLQAALDDAKAQAAAKSIIQKVPVYVTRQADARCVVPRGFQRLHDAAAGGADLPGISGAAGQPDDATSGVALSAVAGTVAANYGTYAEVSAKYRALQKWVADQRAIAAAPPK